MRSKVSSNGAGTRPAQPLAGRRGHQPLRDGQTLTQPPQTFPNGNGATHDPRPVAQSHPNKTTLPTGAVYADLPDPGVSEHTGVDWSAALRHLLHPTNDPLCGPTGARFHFLGNCRDLLPSRKRYSVAMIGDPHHGVTLAEFQADMAFLNRLRAEAAALGLEITTDYDNVGESIMVQAEVVPALALRGGYVLVQDR